MNTVAARFFTKICQNPLRYYVKGISVGFGTTLGVNFFTGFNDGEDSIVNIAENPHLFTLLAVAKSISYGLVWPSIPLAIYHQRKHYTTLCHGWKTFLDKCDEYEESIRLEAQQNSWW